METLIKKLRDRQPLRLFYKNQKLFVSFILNKTDNRICWKRLFSLDRRNWVEQNAYLSLKDVLNCIKYHKAKEQTTQ